MKILALPEFKISPAQVFENIFKHRPYPFLLESAMRNKEFGRYSIMGADPFLRFKSKGRSVRLFENGKTRSFNDNPFTVLKSLLSRCSSKNSQLSTLNSQLPFTGGAVGYFSYDLGWQVERLPDKARDDLELPDCYLCFYKNAVILDHFKNKAFILGPRAKELMCSLVKLKKNLKSGDLSHFKGNKSQECVKSTPKNIKIKSNFKRLYYIDTIKKVKRYISLGDIYQANLSQRLEADIKIPAFDLYKRLGRINPAPFAAFLDYGDFAIVSSSPERFLLVKNGRVESRPIKGTRPRGKDARQDRKLAEELLNSKKDRAELIMIVDLERNDLGRVCEYGTVRVKKQAVLEKYPTVFHTAATVQGKLYKGKDAVDLLRATFPGGSITGAPKIRAMQIIEELEPTKRSAYTGSIGYIDFNGRMDLNIAIRTFVLKNGRAYFQVGGGIVADSDPQEEYQETLDKAKAMIAAVTG